MHHLSHFTISSSVVDTETGLAEEKKDERSRLVGLVREIERFLSDGLVKVFKRKRKDKISLCNQISGAPRD